MTVEVTLPYDKEYVTNFSQGLQEPEWMKNLRLSALEKSESLPLPKPDKTNISKWNFTEFDHHVTSDKIENLDDLPVEIKDFLDQEKEQQNLVIQRNHTVAYAAIEQQLKDKGVIFTDMLTAVREHSDLVEKYFMNDAVHVDEHRLTALHAALVNGGVFLYVPKNVQIEEPIQAIFWQEDPKASLINHILVVAEENSSVTYVENYISHNKEEKTSSNIVAEVIAKDGAKVSFGAVDNFEAGTTVYANRRGVAYRDAVIEWALGQMNEGDTVSENITHLIGDNSHSNAKTVAIGRGAQKQNFTANITHFGKGSDGYILQHGVMKDKASAIFNGIGKIEHGASKSNAEQESRVLMLSKDARGDANPILLIDEDDVTAGHAASVGRVDPIQLYYLMSRGISRFEAERLIIHGFLAPVVNQLPVEAVKRQLRQVIERKVY
ncbi:Fe-S cluster assembly protein SufD [Halobacillus litoralis]|uniref:Fe-S cluster assembly protein SufD n=1 Tax=Halobacillus litoralis TaxID=45668 RepID=A0A845E4E1_9BACI|nr:MULTISPECIES: Fe-S cluster assembly protein SufD [Halobacillus]MCA1024025.1 Fe-S cluster assembly protein SufD [Halobacillus litoralis]MYL21107.1 Fe-S cluster assembly protein SufD [Halobacillus litoralis]MYL31357.1 Fe-S cluster assembly protein SufD [Halobacillus halophilus]MYL38488.1 Fe-S cluster assembly protein SufD [Halobacillus litoralis]